MTACAQHVTSIAEPSEPGLDQKIIVYNLIKDTIEWVPVELGVFTRPKILNNLMVHNGREA